MSALKTKKTGQSVTAFIESIEDLQTRRDCKTLLKLMKNGSGAAPKLWGNGVVGFGEYRYKSAASQGEWYQMGFAPRKANISLQFMYPLDKEKKLLEKMGNPKMGKGCIYIKKLSDIDLQAVQELVAKTAKHHKKPE